MSEKIAIVGSGLVASGWAIVFARAGFDVSVYDLDRDASARAILFIADRVVELEAAGLVSGAAEIVRRVRIASDLRDALNDACYVQESVLETLDSKQGTFEAIDSEVGPSAIMGSSSSGIPASRFTDGLGCRNRCLVAHPLNPPYLAPIVELVPAPWTSPETVNSTKVLMSAAGQSPVVMRCEEEGFILNRLQGVLLMKAWRLVARGLGDRRGHR